MYCGLKDVKTSVYILYGRISSVEVLVYQETAVGLTTHVAKAFEMWQNVTGTTSQVSVTHHILKELDTLVSWSFTCVCPRHFKVTRDGQVLPFTAKTCSDFVGWYK